LAKTTTDMDQLKMLLDYTKFHIGLYSVVITALLALIAFGVDKGDTGELLKYRTAVLIVTGLILLAGLCAGIVAAAIPNQRSFLRYWNGPCRILGMPVWFLKVRCVAALEHFFFWSGVLLGFMAVLSKGNYWLF